jgi:hypothetical protein
VGFPRFGGHPTSGASPGKDAAEYSSTMTIGDSTITNGGVCSCSTTANVDIRDSTLSGNGVVVDATDGSASVQIQASTIAANRVGI